MLGSWIRANGYHTSYSSLAQRAKKNNNIWNRLVRKGRPARRVCMFGERRVPAAADACSLCLALNCPSNRRQAAAPLSSHLLPAGLLQLIFTLGCLLLVIPIYKSFVLSLVWQVGFRDISVCPQTRYAKAPALAVF